MWHRYQVSTHIHECVWVCDKVSDDVMNKDERDEREREREKEAEREVWRLWILRSGPHETFKT